MTSLRSAFALSDEQVKNATPPGTSTLVGKNSITFKQLQPTHCNTDHLERTASQDTREEIRLVPQPSQDPADPLNLPFWRKLAILAVMSIHPFVVNVASASLSSALPICECLRIGLRQQNVG